LLSADGEATQLRTAAQEAGVYGRIIAATLGAELLPYAENLLNLIVHEAHTT
jgi:hypothetical protein